jgi:hypothetical protein
LVELSCQLPTPLRLKLQLAGGMRICAMCIGQDKGRENENTQGHQIN